jgi:hypothetical protein
VIPLGVYGDECRDCREGLKVNVLELEVCKGDVCSDGLLVPTSVMLHCSKK